LLFKIRVQRVLVARSEKGRIISHIPGSLALNLIFQNGVTKSHMQQLFLSSSEFLIRYTDTTRVRS